MSLGFAFFVDRSFPVVYSSIFETTGFCFQLLYFFIQMDSKDPNARHTNVCALTQPLSGLWRMQQSRYRDNEERAQQRLMKVQEQRETLTSLMGDFNSVFTQSPGVVKLCDTVCWIF